jgi:hypothetical protein
MAFQMLRPGFGEEKMTCHAQCRQTIGKLMARHLFLVSRHEARLYEYLLERFRDDGNVEVILDRRRGERRGRPHGQESDRRRSDRRTRREVDVELRIRSHVILTLPENDPEARH